MSNYEIVYDEEKLDEFIEWLPELKETESYFLQLFGRKKYLEKGAIQSGQQSLQRISCKKEQIKSSIKKMEVELGLYTNREVILPSECLVVYITPNPRCNFLAAKNLLKTLADKITHPYDGYDIRNLAMTEIHRACSRKLFIDFDFDDVDFFEMKEQILEIVNKEAIHPIKTRSGFHLLVEHSKIEEERSRVWYKQMLKLNPDVSGDKNMLIPIPGTLHGGKEVYEIN